jgi:hypothetical protein
LQHITIEDVESFPLEPKVGSFIFMNKRVMVCIEVATHPVWIPLTQEFNTYIHRQEIAGLTWVVNHNMNSTSVIVQCFDETNSVIIPSEIVSTDNHTVTITFSTPTSGQAVTLLGSFDGTAKPNIAYEQTFENKSTVNVPHLLGYEPVIRVIIDGYEIQPDSILHIDNNNAIVEFSGSSTGKVIAT